MGQLVAQLGWASPEMGLAQLEQLAELAPLAQLVAQLVGQSIKSHEEPPRAQDRSAGCPAHPVLQHRLPLLLSSGSKLESGCRAGDPVQSLFPGFRVGLGRRLPVGRLACRRADGIADRLLSRGVPHDRWAEARRAAAGAFVSNERNLDRPWMVCI